jgi:outer membrane lipopolysaccharide assembly protein LptE/RlpB
VRILAGLGVLSLALTAGCGYHAVGAATHVPANVRTLAVPIFQSKVQAYRTETVFTEAVVRELNTRTKYRVLTASGDGTFTGATADAVLRGTILSQTIAPLTYDPSSGQTSSYLVTITAQVVLTTHAGKVLYRNDAFAWHEQYQSTQDLSGSLQEDSAAVRRMARDFAQAVVSDMLESF